MAHGSDLTTPAPGDIRPGTRRGAEGGFHVAQHLNGHWSLFDPAGRAFFLRAVHDVRSEPADTEGGLARHPAVRLREWGFNAVGLGGDGAGRDDGMPFFAAVEFCRAVPVVSAPGVHLPDVFAPEWPELAHARAALVCPALAGVPDLIGWVTDAPLAWGQAAADRAGLLQVCLSLEPSFAAYHAAWEFLLALHAGRLDAVARAWGVPLPNKEVVRDRTRSDSGLTTRGYLRDEARWAREFATRYFATTSAAIRAADPGHLVCGCRFAGPASAAVLGAAAYPGVDVPLLPWTELPASGPVIADQVSCLEDGFAALPVHAGTVRRPQRLTSVERMLRRARAALQRLARHPSVVGYVWRQWCDEPGEQPPFARGLVHVSGRDARVNVELSAEFNARAELVRRSAAKRLSS